MFESLSEKLGNVFSKLRGKAALSENDVMAVSREIRIALLEADVALPVVKEFVAGIKDKAVGQEVIKGVNPAHQVIKIVHDALIEMLGSQSAELKFGAAPCAYLMVGLQGSGKTTSTAKIAKILTEKKNKKVLMASLDVYRPAAQEQLAASQTQTEGVSIEQHPNVQRASARVREAYLAVQRTQLVAPLDGHVAKRGVQVGQRVQAGAPLMTLVALNELWVDANFKESQLQSLRIGQSADLVADVYGDKVTYHGRITGLGAGTGAAFALLPAQNATGNWIKVVQRIQVNIALDDYDRDTPLSAGMSAVVDIDTGRSRTLQRLLQLSQNDRLADEIVHPGRKKAFATLAHHVCGQRNDVWPGLSRAGLCANPARRLHAIHLRHFDIHQHDRKELRLQPFHRRKAIVDHGCAHAQRLKLKDGQPLIQLVVLDHKHWGGTGQGADPRGSHRD